MLRQANSHSHTESVRSIPSEFDQGSLLIISVRELCDEDAMILRPRGSHIILSITPSTGCH